MPACRFLPDARAVTTKSGGGLVEVRHATLVRRDVFEAVRDQAAALPQPRRRLGRRVARADYGGVCRT